MRELLRAAVNKKKSEEYDEMLIYQHERKK